MQLIDERNIHKLYAETLTQVEQDFKPAYVVQQEETWTYFRPQEGTLPAQGWKIHLSVVPPEGIAFIQSVTDYLFKNRLHWKVLSTYKLLERCSYGGVSLPQTGKFITIYIEQPEALHAHLSQLHHLTQGFKGVLIPTDKRYQPDSCVFFRYGAFEDMFFYDPYNSTKTPALYKDDGSLVEDKRVPGYYKPNWVADPYVAQEPTPTETTEENAFLQRGIQMVQVLKQSGKGGVYCIQTNEWPKCLMKEGRKNTLYDSEHRSVKNRLENEYNILAKLSPLGFTPVPIEIFDYSDNTYMITEYLEGESLRSFVENMHYRGEYDHEILPVLINKLEEFVMLCHQQGITIRDLSPNNVVIVNQTDIKLIDFELAVDASTTAPPFSGFTLGYVPVGYEHEPRKQKEFDYFALGAIYYFIATSLDPYWDMKPATGIYSKLHHYLQSLSEYPLKQLGMKGLEFMQEAFQTIEARNQKHAADTICPFAHLDQAKPRNPFLDKNSIITYTHQLVAKLESEMTFSNPTQLIKQNALAQLFHPANFNYGLSGIAHFIKEAAIVTKDEKHLHLAIEMTQWILNNHPFKAGTTPVGLYFGYGYLPWLLVDLSILANKPELAQQAKEIVELLMQEELTQYNISHGSAGLGLMLLHLYKVTKDVSYLNYSIKMAEHVASGIERKDDVVLWKTLDKKKSYYPLGYSHGVAGIGYFLAALYQETKQEEYLLLVQEALHTIIHTALSNGPKDGAIWRHSYGDSSQAWTFWCNGSAGVAKFLLLVDHLGLDERARSWADKAIKAISSSKVYGSNCQCHGLSGNGDFLIDANLTIQSAALQSKIEEYMDLLHALSIDQDGLPLWNVEDRKTISPDFMTGYTGNYSFLLRYHFALPQPLSYIHS